MLLRIIVELMSVYFCFQADFLTQNFTEYLSKNVVIALIYGIVVSLLIIHLLKDYIHQKIIAIFALCFILAMILPYHINEFINQLHSIFAGLSVIMIYGLITYTINIYYPKMKLYHLFILFLSALIFVHYSVVNSLLEILLITYICFLDQFIIKH